MIRYNNSWLLNICNKCSWIWKCHDCHQKINSDLQKINQVRLALKKIPTQRIKQLKGSYTHSQMLEKLEAAIRASETNQNELALLQFEQIERIIDSSPQKTSQDNDILAYVCASLTNLYILTKNPKYQSAAKKALSIYQKTPQRYIEEIITIKNNLALVSNEENNQKVDCPTYQEVLALEDKFYSIQDERRLSTLNNLMCSYFEKGKKQQAESTYKICSQIIASSYQAHPIKSLIEQNYRYYNDQIKDSLSKSLPDTTELNK